MVNLRLGFAAAAFFLGGGLLVAACGGGGSRHSQAPPPKPRTGGIAQFSLAADTDYTDPALAYYQVSWQFEYATCAKLLNYPDKPAPEGSQLQPEIARSMPTVSSDRKTYVFTIRGGFRFSPPSNQPVTARTMKYTIERALNRRLKSPARYYVSDIV